MGDVTRSSGARCGSPRRAEKCGGTASSPRIRTLPTKMIWSASEPQSWPSTSEESTSLWLHQPTPLRRSASCCCATARASPRSSSRRWPIGEGSASACAESVLEVPGTVSPAIQPRAWSCIEPAVCCRDARAGPAIRRDGPVHRPARRLFDHAVSDSLAPADHGLAALAAASVHGFRTALDARGFVEIHTPKVVASATEGGANVFPIDWFGRTAFLAQSPQFYKRTMSRRVRVRVRGRAGLPLPAARRYAGIWPSTCRSTPRCGFIADHTTSMAVLLRSDQRADRRRRRPGRRTVGSSSSNCPWSRTEIPVIDFEEALRLIQDAHRRDEARRARPGCPATKRVADQGPRASSTTVRRHPDDRAARHPERSRSFDLLFRGVELGTRGQRPPLQRLPRRPRAAPTDGYLEALRHGDAAPRWVRDRSSNGGPLASPERPTCAR